MQSHQAKMCGASVPTHRKRDQKPANCRMSFDVQGACRRGALLDEVAEAVEEIDLDLLKQATLGDGAGAYCRKKRSSMTVDSSASIGR